MKRLYTLWFVALVVSAAVSLMLLLRAGDERVPQTRIENDVPVLIAGVPHRCDFSITSDSDSRDSASATCEEASDG